MKFLFPIVLGCVAVSCSSPPPDFVPRLSKLDDSSSGPTDLAGAKMPVLRSEYFEKAWGAPTVQRLADGGWRLRYRRGNTLNFVSICSMRNGQPSPALPPSWQEPSEGPTATAAPVHPQRWRYATILGQAVKWYQVDGGTGADFPTFKTADFQATTPDGRNGWYRIEVQSDREAEVADQIKRVNW